MRIQKCREVMSLVQDHRKKWRWDTHHDNLFPFSSLRLLFKSKLWKQQAPIKVILTRKGKNRNKCLDHPKAGHIMKRETTCRWSKDNKSWARGAGGWWRNSGEGSQAQFGNQGSARTTGLSLRVPGIHTITQARFARLGHDILADLGKNKCLAICPLKL